jgi:hypothetical protein
MSHDQRETVRRKLREGVAAGFVATLVMTVLLFAAPLLGGWRSSQAAARLLELLRAHPILFAAALIAHLAYGSSAGGLFAAGARAVDVTRGALFGLGLWALAVAVYAPLVGLGFIGSHQPALAVMALPLHAAYGVALGAFAPRGEITQPLEAPKRAQSEAHA